MPVGARLEHWLISFRTSAGVRMSIGRFADILSEYSPFS